MNKLIENHKSVFSFIMGMALGVWVHVIENAMANTAVSGATATSSGNGSSWSSSFATTGQKPVVNVGQTGTGFATGFGYSTGFAPVSKTTTTGKTTTFAPVK